MQPEKEIIIGSEDDPDNPRHALSNLNKRQIPKTQRGKIIYIPFERTKILCPFHKMRTLINMADSPVRERSNKMIEFECSCGTNYIRTQDLNKVSPEWRH